MSPRRQTVVPVVIRRVNDITGTQVIVTLPDGRRWELPRSQVDFSPTATAVIIPEWLYAKLTRKENQP